MTSKKSDVFNFEKSLTELTKLIEKMEQGDLPLEKSLQHYEEGISLIRQAQQALQKAEQKVQRLSTQGKESLTTFDTNDDNE